MARNPQGVPLRLGAGVALQATWTMLWLPCGALAAPSVPVSPGLADRLAPIEDRCPTFSLVAGEQPLELAVYRLRDRGSLEPDLEPAILQALPAGASTWTPPADRCLPAGGVYGWAVREISEAANDWSAPLLFTVVVDPERSPTTAPVDRGVPSIADPVAEPAVDGEGASRRRGRAPDRALDRVASTTTAPVKLSVDGAVQAAAFAGDGSALTGIDWSALTNVPAGFADGTDDVIVYAAGNQLQLQGTTFDVVEGAGSDLDADLLDGLEGAAYAQQALTYTKDEVDSLLVIDNIGAPIPVAPERLRLGNEPRDPAMRRLAWNMPSLAGVASFVVYQADFAIDDANKTSARRQIAGTLHVAVDLYPGSGWQHFRVEAVNVLGVAGPLSAELVVDTTSRLAYRGDQRADNLFELFTVRPIAGSQETRVSGDLVSFGDVTDFAWSPDGSRIVYRADQEADDVFGLWVTPAAGGAAVEVNDPLTPGGDVGFDFAWSPDGTLVAYVADQDTDGVNELYVVPAGGGGSTKVSGAMTAGGNVLEFAWSPDGTRLVYRADQETDGDLELYVAFADGGGATRINDDLVAGGDVFVFEWSPEGSRIAYKADQDTDDVYELYVVPAIGGASTKVSDPPVPGGDVLDFAWSPDGTRLLYRADQETDEQYELFVVPATGGESAKVSDSVVSYGIFGKYDWSPDGTRVAFVADQVGGFYDQLLVVPAAGGGATKLNLSSTSVSVADFAWSPDGSRLAYIADQDTNNVKEVYVVSAAGGGATKVSGPLVAGGGVLALAWAPDGTRIAYRADQDTDDVTELYVASASGGSTVKVSGPLVPGGAAGQFAWSPLGTP